MIKLSNGHSFDYMVASGALAFDGKGWPWERPLVKLGLIKPELFTVVAKSVTLKPVKGNLRWYWPFTCVKLLCGGGVVNKVGLSNKGIDWFVRKVLDPMEKRNESLPSDFHQKIVVSLFGTKDELRTMVRKLHGYRCIIAFEVNVSCPNSGHAMDQAKQVIESVKLVRDVGEHPVIVKVSVDQNYLAIAKGLKGIAEAISINSVPWNKAFPDDPECKKSPLQWLMKKLKRTTGSTGGGGGVSGKPAQKENWKAVEALAIADDLPVIGPSIMEYGDLGALEVLGASAFSFGAIHIRTPWKPTQIVERHLKENKTIEVFGN